MRNHLDNSKPQEEAQGVEMMIEGEDCPPGCADEPTLYLYKEGHISPRNIAI